MRLTSRLYFLGGKYRWLRWVRPAEVVLRSFVKGRRMEFDPTTYLVFPKEKLIYVVVSKSACSSIMAALTPMIGVNWTSTDDYSVHELQWKRSYQLGQRFDNYFIFSFVRNPYERLVSAYVSKCIVDPEKHGQFHFGDYVLGFLFRPNQSFESFVDTVVRIPDLLSDRHFKSQYGTIFNRRTNRIDYIGRVENLRVDFEPIHKRYMTAHLPNLNASGKKDWRTYYNTRIARKVYRRYRKDFVRFGYSDAHDDLMNYLDRTHR